MKVNPSKIKAIRFKRAQVKNPLGDQKIPEANSYKYLGIIYEAILSKRNK
jgi:hypothetical protein